MKYNQPYGESDPNAPYVNGNPSTGTMGSIPPAASIEFPQREIANFILDNGIAAPSNSDLRQLVKGVQSNATNFKPDVGVQNAVVVPLIPVPDAYYSGMQVRFRAAYAPSGPATLDAGRGARPIRKSSGGTIVGSEWVPGDIVEVTYDSVLNVWQLPISAVAMLYAPRDFYVNDTTGLDTNDGLTAGAPFKTIQKAAYAAQLYNQNGYAITIHVANGGYAKTQFGAINGSGVIYLRGNSASPASCIIHSTAGNGLVFPGDGRFDIEGFRIVVDASIPAVGDPGNGVFAIGALCILGNMEYGYCAGSQIAAANAGTQFINGPSRVTGGAGWSHFSATTGSQCFTNTVNNPAYTFTAACNYPAGFAYADLNSTVTCPLGAIAGYGNVTGSKFQGQTNGVINSMGRGTGYLPGDIAGVLYTGAQYN